MESLVRDLRFALRMMLQKPGFTSVAILTLALGIGVNTAVFSIVNTLLLRRLPVERPDELTSLSMGISHTSYANYRDISEFATSSGLFSGVAAHRTQELNVGQGEGSQRAFGEVVSGNYFSLLGVHALRGRVFGTETDSAADGSPVAVISYSFWKRSLNLRDDVVGSEILINGHKFTVIGVTPEAFAGTFAFLIKPDIYVPLGMYTTVIPDRNALERRSRNLLEMFARRKPGVSMDQAKDAILSVAIRLKQSYPLENSTFDRAQLYPLDGLGAFRGMSYAPALFAFLGLMVALVGTVLLIACANLANLLLARSWDRRKEMALRMALGARRQAIVQQLLTESVMLAGVGGAAGCVLAKILVDAAPRFQPPVPIPVEFNFALDARVLLYAAVLSMVTGILFGSAPAWHSVKESGIHTLIKTGAAREGRGMRRWNFRNMVVVGQVAGSLVLLVCTGIFARSLQRLTSVDPGFRVDHVVNAGLNLQAAGFDDVRGPLVYERIAQRVREMGGVEDVTLGAVVPLTLNTRENPFQPEGKGSDYSIQSLFNTVSPHYFSTLRIPLKMGRDFGTEDNVSSRKVAIVNQTFAERVWPGENALGKRVRTMSGPNQWSDWVEVVGVVGDTKYRSPGDDPTPIAYFPLAQNYEPVMTLQARVSGDPGLFQAVLRGAITSVEKSLIVQTSTFREDVALSLLPPRIAAVLLGVLGGLGLLLATLGLYGLISYIATRRSQEMGIRIALGATPGHIFRLVIAQGLRVVATGTAIGIGVALVITFLLSRLISSIRPLDPLTYAGVIAILSIVALAASFMPARRAVRTDPMVALRTE